MATIGNLDKKYVSALTLQDQRDIDGRVIDIAGESSFIENIKMLGRAKPAKVPWFYLHTNEAIYGIGDTTGETVTGTGTATITATTTVATSGQFRKDDILKLGLKNARVYSKSTSGGKDTFVLHSVDGSNITFVAGGKLVWSSNAAAEGSGQRENLRHKTEAYYNHIQILNESVKSTDISNLTTIEAPEGSTYTVKQHADAVLRLQKAISGMMIGGQISTTRFSDANPALADAAGYGVQTSMGLDQYTTMYGGYRALTTLGTVVIADMDTREDAMIAKRLVNKNLVVMGSIRSMRPYSSYLLNLGSSGITSVRMNIDGREVNMSVQKWTRPGGFSYEFMPCNTFNDPSMYPVEAGVTDIGQCLYYLPKDSVNVEGGGTAERFRIRYLDQQAHIKSSGPNVKWSDLIKETITGGLAPVPTGTDRTLEGNWVSYQALECAGAQHFYKEKTVSA